MKKRKKRRTGWRTLVILLLLILAALLCRDNLQVRRVDYDLSCRDLPEAFDGLKILQISDLHGRDILTKQLLSQAEAASPDLIFLTGDLADGEGQLTRLEPLIRGLADIAPLYYVTGNHEWALADTEGFLRDLSGLGVTLLRNRFVTLERNEDRLLLAGVEDPNGYADMKTPEAMAREMEAAGGGFSLLLAHRPEYFPDYAALGFRVIFSGHVHGGMLRLPLLGGLLAPGHVLFPEYDGGLYTLGDSVMILSRGLAGVNDFPRIFNPMEVPVVVLHRGEKG